MVRAILTIALVIATACHRGVNVMCTPVNVETFVAVTPQNIEQMAEVRFSVTSPEDEQVIRNAISTAPSGAFERTRVRMLIEIPDRPRVYIDSYGGLLDGVRQGKMSDAAFATMVALARRYKCDSGLIFRPQ